MNKVGTIKVGELDLPIYVEQGDIDKIVAKFQVINPTTPPVIVPPPALPTIPPINSENSYKVEMGGKFKKVTWNIKGGSGNYSYRLGDSVYTGSMFVEKDIDWDVVVIDNGTRKEYNVKVNTSTLGVINFNGTGITPEITVEIPTTPPVVVQNTLIGFAEVGRTYFSHYKPKLHFPTRENSFEAQVFRCEKDGVVIYEYDRPQGWNTESSYQGNHPQESNFAVSEGIYKFYFKNTGTKPIIDGITSGNGYEFYDIPGALAKTEHHNRLMPGGIYSFQQDIKIKEYKQNARRSWDDSQYAFFLTAPFYENGSVTTDKIEVENYPNGLWIQENGTQVNKFYKKSDPSKFIIIEFRTFGLNSEPTFKVVQKNGLDIKPDFTMVSSWESTQWKVFNNVSSGYVDSPDYIAK